MKFLEKIFINHINEIEWKRNRQRNLKLLDEFWNNLDQKEYTYTKDCNQFRLKFNREEPEQIWFEMVRYYRHKTGNWERRKRSRFAITCNQTGTIYIASTILFPEDNPTIDTIRSEVKKVIKFLLSDEIR
jgi:hypothetical protein